MIVLLLLACTDAGGDTAVAPPPELLDDARLIRRLSLDLRGVYPSVEELDGEPMDLRDAFLEDPRLEERLVVLLGERWHTLVDEFNVGFYDFDLPMDQEYAFQRAVGEEPLRLMAHVAVTDQPWSQVVTADYTMANPLLAEIWPLEHTGEDWAPATWTDGRPPVGVLASNGLWWRYPTSLFNFNRQRVAAISRLLLCQDYLLRPVSFDGTPSLSDSEGTEEALREEPYCQGCHVSIEPIAASLFGFSWTDAYSSLEVSVYHPERELTGETVLGVAPAFYGIPISGLEELGPAVAADPRFASCAVETMSELLLRKEVDEPPWRQDFVDSGLSMKALLRAITGSEDYALDEPRLMTADLLASAVEDLTGFRWTWQGFDQLRNDKFGYRLLAGGVDGRATLRAQALPGLTWALVVKRLAEGGARQTSGDREELSELALRVTAQEPPAELYALYDELLASSGAEAAWQAAVAALLRDPEALFL